MCRMIRIYDECNSSKISFALHVSSLCSRWSMSCTYLEWRYEHLGDVQADLNLIGATAHETILQVSR